MNFDESGMIEIVFTQQQGTFHCFCFIANVKARYLPFKYFMRNFDRNGPPNNDLTKLHFCY
jgi:hypothetical protein